MGAAAGLGWARLGLGWAGLGWARLGWLGWLGLAGRAAAGGWGVVSGPAGLLAGLLGAWAALRRIFENETEIGLFENGKGVLPPQNGFPDGQRQQAISIYFFLEGLGFRGLGGLGFRGLGFRGLGV